MAFKIFISILTAVLWMFLQNSFTISSFIFGLFIAVAILLILRRVLTGDYQIGKLNLWAVIKLFFLFVVELTKANIDMVKVVTKPKLNHQPGIVAVRTRLETDMEITLLAALITLTPGTVSMDFSPDNRTIYIHSIDVPDKDELIDDIHNSFEKAILEVTK